MNAQGRSSASALDSASRSGDETGLAGLDASTVAGGVAAVRRLEAKAPGLTILWHPDVRRVGERFSLSLPAAGRGSELSRRQPAFVQPGEAAARPLGDPYLSRTPLWIGAGRERGAVSIERRSSPTRITVDGVELGDSVELARQDVERGVVLLLADRVALLLHAFSVLPARDGARHGLVGDSDAMVELREQVARVADLAVPVLLRGETGVGKELVARAIHQASPRRERPFLAVNLGALPPSLAAAELFGAVRGAFTGADHPRAGLFARADGGTLLLDEVGEAPAEVQVLLLRVLEAGELWPLGADRPRRVEVRVIAATDADLEDAVVGGRFRAPLLHRLSGYPIEVPPLGRRRDDVGRLILHFLRQELAAVGRPDRLSPRAPGARPWLPAAEVARLAAADWPGNVRQLRNVVQQLVIANRDAAEASLPARLASSDGAGAPRSRSGGRAYRRAGEVDEEDLLAALRADRFQPAAAARRLGISRTALYARIDRSAGLRKAAEVGRAEIDAALARHGGDLEAVAADLEVSPRGLRLRLTSFGPR